MWRPRQQCGGHTGRPGQPLLAQTPRRQPRPRHGHPCAVEDVSRPQRWPCCLLQPGPAVLAAPWAAAYRVPQRAAAPRPLGPPACTPAGLPLTPPPVPTEAGTPGPQSLSAALPLPSGHPLPWLRPLGHVCSAAIRAACWPCLPSLPCSPEQIRKEIPTLTPGSLRAGSTLTSSWCPLSYTRQQSPCPGTDQACLWPDVAGEAGPAPHTDSAKAGDGSAVLRGAPGAAAGVCARAHPVT